MTAVRRRRDDHLFDPDAKAALMEKRCTIDLAEVARLYVEERLTLEKVAERFGCGVSTITRRLVDLGIMRRRRRPDRGRRGGVMRVTWSADLAWVVGPLATDGNLSPNGRSLVIVSKDVDLLETVRCCLGIGPAIRPHGSGFGGSCHRLPWTDRAFYEWLLRIGLMPRKSLRLTRLDVPDEWFADFLRGCIDGDGSITVYTDRYHAAKDARYVYERLWVSLVSASESFVDWIRQTAFRLRGVRGSLNVRYRPGRAPIWQLKYGKRESIDLVRWMYYAPDIPSLARKRVIASRFLDVLGHAPKRGIGRPRVGWLYNEAPR